MKKKVLISIGIITTSIIGIFVFSVFSRYNKVVVKPVTSRVIFDQTTPTPTPDPLAPYNVLLLGYGGAYHEGGYLTDTIIATHVRPRDKKIILISLPRDIWTPLPLLKNGEKVYWKINAAYAFGRDQGQYTDRPREYTGDAGGGELAKYAAEYVTGLPMRYFIALSFNGFQESIDTLGNINVNVPHTFEDDLYPIEEEAENDCGKEEEEIEELTATMSGELLEREFPCRYETISFTQGLEEMNGERALKFVRSRKSQAYGGDYNRSKRQLALLQGVKEKIISINFIPKLLPFMNSLTRDMQTDIDAGTLKTILDTHPDISEFTIDTVSLTIDNALDETRSDDGQYVLVPKENEDDWESVHEYIQKEIQSASQ